MNEEWLQGIPSHWDRIPLKYLFKFVSGGTPEKGKENYWGGEIPWVSPKDMKSTTISETENSVTEKGMKESSTRLIPSESLLIVVRSGILGRTIPIALIKESVSINQDIQALIPTEDHVNPRFVQIFIRSHEEELLTQWKSKGATVESLDTSQIGGTRIPLPGLDEQNKIIAFSRKKEQEISKAINYCEDLIDILSEKERAHIEDLILNGERNHDIVIDSNLSVRQKRPKGWELRRAKTLFAERNDKGYSNLPLLEVSLNHGVRLRDDNDDRNAWVASDLGDMKRVAEGDIVFNKMRLWQGAVGRSEYEGLVSPDYTVLKPRSDANSAYYSYLLRTDAYKTEVDRRSYGVVDDRKRIYWKQFGDLPLLYPSLSEQEMIVEQVQNSEQQINELQSRIKSTIELLKEKRRSLIAKAVTGQIDLTNWQPSEEYELSA